MYDRRERVITATVCLQARFRAFEVLEEHWPDVR